MKENSEYKTLVIITGPTAVGKTQTSIDIAEKLQTEIISADARQFYKELRIGTAAPTLSENQRVKHYLAGHLSVFDYYNARLFEKDALKVIDKLFLTKDFVVATGGSGLYIDTLCQGIDKMPDISEDIRNKAKEIYLQNGIEGLRFELKRIDPVYYDEVDKTNPNRMLRGIEVFYATGERISDLRKKKRIKRPFQIKKIVLNLPRKELFSRINLRTHDMIRQGLVDEAIGFFKYRHLNALNTVGYKEIFAWHQNIWNLNTAIEKIKTNTRRYAKRQLTWFNRYEDARWFQPWEDKEIMRFITEKSRQ
ncbi:MAG: tRNA (adenosine(37)-N6)-dimethylallyltransferase MiaA [Bacteroidetes bacterium]|nr:MAG: tRNA (adenosine(37)-N6)-dimethylallyltransferase MiaA [Bacteroidota bacterium]